MPGGDDLGVRSPAQLPVDHHFMLHGDEGIIVNTLELSVRTVDPTCDALLDGSDVGIGLRYAVAIGGNPPTEESAYAQRSCPI